VRIHQRGPVITGAGLDPSCTPAGIPPSGSDGEGCWGEETAGANAVVGVDVGRVVAVPVGGAAVVRFVEPGHRAAAGRPALRIHRRAADGDELLPEPRSVAKKRLTL
jgi:hypothetical protein